MRRPRLRDLGVSIGVLATGPTNSLTDVAGVQVGHCTIVEGDSIRTGVTAVKPHSANIFLDKVPAAVHVANGFGKFVGTTQIRELGVIETPILLTNTLSVFAAADALVAWTLNQPGCENVTSVNPVVGECNSLLQATTTTGRQGRTIEAIDPKQVVEICRRYGVLAADERKPREP